MPSPFPGLDPYLEAYWRDVHAALMVYTRDALQERLPGDLFARVEEGVQVDTDLESRVIAPDVHVIESTGPSWSTSTATSAVAVAEPIAVPVEEPESPRHIAIYDRSSGGRVVTAIEFLSPSNKLPGEGREAYKKKQREYVAGHVNLVEVDLIREGVHTVAVAVRNIPKPNRTHYFVCIRRADQQGLAFVYSIHLRHPLPTIRIPLRPTDQDVPLDLQQLINQCYDRGRYGFTIDYSAEPSPPLADPDARWADELLRAAGRRQ